MERTLGCLVISMTVGAAILHWGQPVRSATGRPGGTGLIAPLAPWHVIRVDGRPPSYDPASSGVHFLIDRDGRCHETQNWRAQKRLDHDEAVRVGVHTAEDSNMITQRQVEAVEELREELCRQFGACRANWSDALATPEMPGSY